MSKLKVTKYLIYDSSENRWQAPVDSVSEKTDCVFLPSKSQDSLFFFIEKGISGEQNIPSYISTDRSKISLYWQIFAIYQPSFSIIVL